MTFLEDCAKFGYTPVSTPEQIQEFELRRKLETLKEQAYADLIKSAYKRHARNQIREQQSVDPLIDLVVKDIGVEAFIGETRGRKPQAHDIYHITISAKDGVDPVKFFSQMKKCLKKQVTQGTGVYVLEQRAESGEEPRGWHIHCLITLNTSVSTGVLVQQVYQCFKSYCAKPEFVDVKPVLDKVHYDRVYNEYLNGEKIDEKMPKVSYDKELRKKLQIPDRVEF